MSTSRLQALIRSPLWFALVIALWLATWLPLPLFVHSAVFVGGAGAALAFYWLHCAGPSLYFSGARPATMSNLRNLGVVTFAMITLVDLLNDFEGQAPPLALFGIIAAASWYLAAWPLPRLVGRFSGGIDAGEAQRRESATEPVSRVTLRDAD